MNLSLSLSRARALSYSLYFYRRREENAFFIAVRSGIRRKLRRRYHLDSVNINWRGLRSNDIEVIRKKGQCLQYQ